MLFSSLIADHRGFAYIVCITVRSNKQHIIRLKPESICLCIRHFGVGTFAEAKTRCNYFRDCYNWKSMFAIIGRRIRPILNREDTTTKRIDVPGDRYFKHVMKDAREFEPAMPSWNATGEKLLHQSHLQPPGGSQFYFRGGKNFIGKTQYV